MIAHERKEDRWAATLRNGTAFSAVAPSQRPACDAHQSKIFGSGIPTIMSPRARIPGRLTSKPLGQFPPAGLSVRPDPHCPAVWPVGHYRPVRCLSASTICGCITACRSDGRRAGLPRATLRGGFHGPLPGVLPIRGPCHDHRQLEIESKGNDYERSPCLQ